MPTIFEGAGGGTVISMIVTLMADRSLPQKQVGYRNMFGYGGVITSLAFAIFFTKSSKELANSVRFALVVSQ